MIDLTSEAAGILSRYPDGRGRSALLPLLHLVQERDGYVTREGMREVAGILGLEGAEVLAVASYYHMLHLRPKGRHIVSVCHNLACSLLGAEGIIAALESHLGVRCRETTPDGAITLERVECLAACDLAAMLQIDYDEMRGPLTVESAIALVDQIRVEEPALLVDTIPLSRSERELLGDGGKEE